MDFSSHQLESMNQSLIHKSKYFQIDYETELNEEQQKVVFADEGPLLVIAGAGSGKTRTITYRVARLIEQGVNPENILLATFTNKAAREMLHRVECLLGLSINRMWGGTFHHIGNLILRREAKKVGFDFNYTILDREDQKDLVETCILQSGVDIKARRFPKADVVMQVINLCRNTLVSIEDIIDKNYPQFREWTGNISHIFALYQNRKRELNCMDFDDLLSYVWELFQKDEATRRKYAQMFHHVLVDEYQDTNLIQAEIVDFFASEYRNVLAELLKQTEGKGINIYTHGEMLPTHAYPELKKYPHFVGNYGGAWQDQQKEFDAFPGAILMTTNCIQKPKESYKSRIFTSGLVAWPGVTHITDRNFAPVIEAALAAPGFPEDEPEKTIIVGFGHNAVMGVADQVINAVKSGAIRHFFLIGGCDGAKTGRNYYTQLAQMVPQDSVILTLACGKYRFNKLEFGDIGGIPRLLDVGQCNDAYSAIQIAVALANAFNTDVNGLPLSFILSWYEQKAVCILLSLLHLGIKNMKLGPSLPAFVTPAALKVLQENFNLMTITTPEADLKAILGE
jgi:hypothetical protein